MRKFVNVALAYAERVHNHVAVLEFHKIESAKCSSVLILFSACQAQIYTFYFVCELCYIVFSQRKLEPFHKCAENAHHQGGRCSQTRTGRSVYKRANSKRKRSFGKLFHNTIVHALVKDKIAVGSKFFCFRKFFTQLLFWRFKHDFPIVGRNNRCVRIHADGCVQNGTAINIRIRRHIGPATCKSQTERCFTSYYHNFSVFLVLLLMFVLRRSFLTTHSFVFQLSHFQ